MLRVALRFCIVTLVLVTSGCVSHWRGQEMEADLVALQGQLEQVTESNRNEREKAAAGMGELKGAIAEVESRFEDAIDRIRTTIADRGLELDQIRQKIAELQGKADELKGKLEEQASGGINVPQPAGAPALPDTAGDLYRYGWEQKGADNCVEAIRAFSVFVQKYKRNSRADNSLYLMAECQYRMKNYTASVRSLQLVLQDYPKGDKVDDSLVLMHDNFVGLGRCKDAMPFLETLLADYPRSNRGKSARKKLARTRKKCR
jgi:TolA-binding protein